LNQGHSEHPFLPGNIHEHLMLADLVRGHTAYIHHVANSQWRCWTLSNTAGLERKTQVFFEVVVPAN
jgi:hypothetical protein